MLSLITGVALDHVLGEPRRYHPLVGFGQLTTALEQRLNIATRSTGFRKTAGVFAVISLTVPPALLAGWLGHSTLLAALLLYLCLGRQSLRAHLLPIRDALMQGDLTQARALVSRIVSRDCAHMDAAQITRAAVESALENGLDAIFATLFWFAVTGPFGAVLHRLANTLDAMWGYRNERFAAFGWAAAKLDDLLAFIPARLCALTYALFGHFAQAMQCWREQAKGMASPNGGPVMCAGAGSLGVTLGGPAIYGGQPMDKPQIGHGRDVQPQDITRALHLIDRGVLLWIVLIVLAELLT